MEDKVNTAIMPKRKGKNKKDPKEMSEQELQAVLSPKQRYFCTNYIKYNNVKEAAIQAGYSEKSASVSGSAIMKNIYALEYIDRHYQRLQKKTIADAEEILQYLTDVMRGEVADQFGIEASLAERTKAAQELAKRQIDMPAKIAEAENTAKIEITLNRKKREDVIN